MKLDRIGPWPYLELPYVPFKFLARTGVSLFCNPNTKSALLGNTRGHSGITFVRMGPWPYLELPYGPFWILPVGEQVYFLSQTLNGH